VVFEDDVRLSRRLPAFLETVGAIGAELIRIETVGGRMRVFPTHATTPQGIGIRQFRSTPVGAAGYVISRSAAEKFLCHPALRRRPVDLVLYDRFERPGSEVTRVLTDPALCQQIGMEDPSTSAIGKSNVVADGIPNLFRQRHPLRWWGRRLAGETVRGARNAVDHLMQQRRGLTRDEIRLDMGE
jgi:glycosyl transferase, family 25